jgi:hypothetical protein
MCIKKKKTEFFFPLKILSWLYPCFCIQHVGKKKWGFKSCNRSYKWPINERESQAMNTVVFSMHFPRDGLIIWSMSPHCWHADPSWHTSKPLNQKNACNNSAIYFKSIACCLKQIWGCNDKKKLMMPNSRILPAALTSQNMQSNSCVQIHQIFCPVWYPVEPLELFPTCQGQPG